MRPLDPRQRPPPERRTAAPGSRRGGGRRLAQGGAPAGYIAAGTGASPPLAPDELPAIDWTAWRWREAYAALAAAYPAADPPRLAALAAIETAPPTDPGATAYLRRAGIDPAAALALAGPVLLAPVAWRGRHVDIADDDDDGAALAAIVLAHAADAETVVDLVAWSVDDPRRYASWSGGLGILGALRAMPGHPVRVHRTPLAWLRAGCVGAVIIDPIAACAEIGRRTGPLLAEDVPHAQAIVAALRPAIGPADVVVPRSALRGRAAA